MRFGLSASTANSFRRRYREVEAVRSVSFDVAPGEVVGFIGPNGAGKTSTLKMLSGVLHPISGEARVLGFAPWRRDYAFLRRIAFIRGSRPIGGPPELTVLDTLRFQRLVYEVPEDEFRRNFAELAELLGLGPLLERQVRALSLGERMRAGLANSLIYRPRVLFLDEPTVGLDVSATAVVRRFIAAYSRQTGATVLLTSHYMADVALAAPALVLAAALRFLFTLTLVQAAFWTQRAQAIAAAGAQLVFLLGGEAAPIPLLPDAHRAWVAALPFRSMIGFPAEVAAGLASGPEILAGYAWQLVWLAAFALATAQVWRVGVRRYTAVGG